MAEEPEETGDLTPRVATLGLVARSADTMGGVSARLSEWHGVRWPRSAAHKHLPVLEKTGLIRRIANGNVTSFDRYEVTPAGERYLHRWLRATARAPEQRDTALGKIMLCRSQEDIEGVIEAMRVEEAMYEQAYLEAHARSAAARRARLRAPTQSDDLRARLRDIGIAGEAALWDHLTKRLRHAREELEGLLSDLGEPQ